MIDRFEGSYAVCENEDKTVTNIPKYQLPLDIKEGDCLLQSEMGFYTIDTEATIANEKRIRDKMDHLIE